MSNPMLGTLCLALALLFGTLWLVGNINTYWIHRDEKHPLPERVIGFVVSLFVLGMCVLFGHLGLQLM